MKRALPAILVLILSCPLALSTQALAEDLLVDGDFELAGEVGSLALGPRWSNNGSMKVVGPNWREGVSPYNGQKAIGTEAQGGIASGTASQTVPVYSSGIRTITLAGFNWVRTAPDYWGAKSGIFVRLFVDGTVVRCYWLPNSPEEEEWVPFEIRWTGQLNGTVKIEIMCQADGRGGEWGVAATDGWSLDISEPKPPRPGHLVNPGFELAGPVGSRSPGPGWWSDLASEVVGPGWFGPPGCPSAPYGYDKAIGCYGHQGLGGGTLYQWAFIDAGYHPLTLRGHIYQWDNEGYAGEATHTIVDFKIDGEVVQSQVFYTPGDIIDNGEWYELRWYWAGDVRGSVGVNIRMEARGNGSADSYGVAIIDDWNIYHIDYTPPTTPVVIDDGEFTGASTQLHCSWSAQDPESGVVNYQYSIGTSPGATDVCNWLNAGLATEVTKAQLSLQVGQTYYFNVRARNDDDLYGQVGSSDGITVIVPTVMSIGQAKTLPDGSIVSFAEKTINRRVQNRFWIQEPDRTAGIAVDTSQLFNVLPGFKMSVTGVMGTRDGERVLRLAAPTVSGAAPPLRPLVIGATDLGGAILEPNLPGLADSAGPNNMGLLVAVYGRVTQIENGYFYVDDGSMLMDGTETSGEPNVGVRVLASPGTLTAGTMVKVIGVSTTFAVLPDSFARAIQPDASGIVRL